MKFCFQQVFEIFACLVALLLGLVLTDQPPLHEKKTICFHVSSMPSRGGSRSAFDYAYHLREIYGDLYNIAIIHPKLLVLGESYQWFEQAFSNNSIHAYDIDPTEATDFFHYKVFAGGKYMIELMEKLPCHFVYTQKFGSQKSQPRYPSSFSDKIPAAVHGIFAAEPHGQHAVVRLNAFITDDDRNLNSSHAVLPHIVNPPPHFSKSIRNKVADLKRSLSIPESSLVVCGFGGFGSFDGLPAMETVISAVFNFNRTQLNFMFMGVDPFSEQFAHDSFVFNDPAMLAHFGIHVFNATADKERTEVFIQSCDAMFHGRTIGETFGLAIAEFSVRNKPVLVHIDSNVVQYDSIEHLRLLGSKGFYCRDVSGCFNVLANWVVKGIPERNYNAYADFTPEIVMKKFKELLLDPVFSPVNTSDSQCSDCHRNKLSLPSNSLQHSVECSSELRCPYLKDCKKYIDEFQPPPPLTCSVDDLRFTDDGPATSNNGGNVTFIPIGFAVHIDDILMDPLGNYLYSVDINTVDSNRQSVHTCIPTKVFPFSQVDPLNTSTYIYGVGDENLYRRNMAHSYFAHTKRKDGWDCMRHYEIIASASVPYFQGVEDMPTYVMPFYPRKLVTRAKALVESISQAKDQHGRVTSFDTSLLNKSAYAETVCCLSAFARRHLTSVALAKYVLSVTNHNHHGHAKNILLLIPEDPIQVFDYLSLALLHGLISLKRADRVTHFPYDPIIFEQRPQDEPYKYIKERRVWGRGYSWAHRIPYPRNYSAPTTEDIRARIEQHAYDLIIFGQVHRGMPLYDVVVSHYDKQQVIFIDGEDFTLQDHALLEVGQNFGWPPFNRNWKVLLTQGHYFKRELVNDCPKWGSREEAVNFWNQHVARS